MADAAAPVGIYHFVNSGEASWYELASKIFALAAPLGGPCTAVSPIASKDYPTLAHRPANSRLRTLRLGDDYGIEPRPWQDAVSEIVNDILSPVQPAAAMKGNP